VGAGGWGVGGAGPRRGDNARTPPPPPPHTHTHTHAHAHTRNARAHTHARTRTHRHTERKTHTDTRTHTRTHSHTLKHHHPNVHSHNHLRCSKARTLITSRRCHVATYRDCVGNFVCGFCLLVASGFAQVQRAFVADVVESITRMLLFVVMFSSSSTME